MAWIQVHAQSAAVKMPVDFQVLAPQHDELGGNGYVKMEGPYPVLFLLHGLHGNGLDWLRYSAVGRHVRNRPVTVIMPDAHNGFWANMKTGQNYMDFITKELPEICGKWFNISSRREDRFIAGFSMGGFGALSAAINNPEIFSKVFAIAPVCELKRLYGRNDLSVKPEWIFGDYETAVNGPSNLYESARKLADSGATPPEFMITCGNGDGLLPGARGFADHLKDLGLPVKFVGGEGAHEWEYADRMLKTAIDWFGIRGEE